MTLIRLILAVLYWHVTDNWITARIPVVNIDFPLDDMADHCHTEACYGILSKEETRKLVGKCRQKGLTVTSAVSSAILCGTSMLLNSVENEPTALRCSISADSRRRCVPPVPNHELSYQVSGIMPFTTPTKDIPKTSQGMWQLAKVFGQHIKMSIDAGQVLAFGLIIGMISQRSLGPPNFAELPSFGISSWGVLPFREQYGQWKLITMVPSFNIIRAVIPFITIQTVNGMLTIMCTGSEPIIPLNVLERLRDETIHKLHQMIED